jgi:hypothetical protein
MKKPGWLRQVLKEATLAHRVLPAWAKRRLDQPDTLEELEILHQHIDARIAELEDLREEVEAAILRAKPVFYDRPAADPLMESMLQDSERFTKIFVEKLKERSPFFNILDGGAFPKTDL